MSMNDDLISIEGSNLYELLNYKKTTLQCFFKPNVFASVKFLNPKSLYIKTTECNMVIQEALFNIEEIKVLGHGEVIHHFDLGKETQFDKIQKMNYDEFADELINAQKDNNLLSVICNIQIKGMRALIRARSKKEMTKTEQNTFLLKYNKGLFLKYLKEEVEK